MCAPGPTATATPTTAPTCGATPWTTAGALHTTQHHAREAFKVKGREFMIDRDYTLATAWKLCTGDRMTDIVFGALTWSPDA